MKFHDGLTLLFIALRLTGYVSWPWVWVLAPFWLSRLGKLSLAIIEVVYNDKY